ncbi:hypothetical protein T07_8417 [Trichinella nelsoni]|uniref:Uncharacterized protein n=1 Tax=Trichinella nelsoni TaxID=6336 RepID=A0A0V0SNP6_9BILA|nr:hypothetical protein T07_8417 [Trichinella nelsoni]
MNTTSFKVVCRGDSDISQSRLARIISSKSRTGLVQNLRCLTSVVWMHCLVSTCFSDDFSNTLSADAMRTEDATSRQQ